MMPFSSGGAGGQMMQYGANKSNPNDTSFFNKKVFKPIRGGGA